MELKQFAANVRASASIHGDNVGMQAHQFIEILNQELDKMHDTKTIEQSVRRITLLELKATLLKLQEPPSLAGVVYIIDEMMKDA